MLKAVEMGWNCGPGMSSARNNDAHAAHDTNRAITKTTRIRRIEVVTDDVQWVYWHGDTAKNESQAEVLATGDLPESLGRAVVGALNTSVYRIGHLARHLGEREPGIKDSYHLPSRNVRYDGFD